MDLFTYVLVAGFTVLTVLALAAVARRLLGLRFGVVRTLLAGILAFGLTGPLFSAMRTGSFRFATGLPSSRIRAFDVTRASTPATTGATEFMQVAVEWCSLTMTLSPHSSATCHSRMYRSHRPAACTGSTRPLGRVTRIEEKSSGSGRSG